jgi:hypothetical protein
MDFTSDELGYAIIRVDKIERFMKNGELKIIPLSIVKEAYYTEKISPGSTLYWIFLLLFGIVFSLFILIKKVRI